MLSDAPVCPTIAVSDMARARKFYGETLGLKVKESPMPEDSGVLYECGKGSVIMVYPSGSAGTNQATYAGFSVKDLDACMKELRDKGVMFEDYDFPGLKTENGVATYGDNEGKSCWFKDPDGNILAIDEGMAS
jgi:catechol 2,3-dioxygenase-like lactoylglutathione lyase family enzyme